MGLHLADCQLERARLCLAQVDGTGSVSDLSLGAAQADGGEEAAGRSRSPFRTELLAQARAAWQQAAALIAQTGYHRRDGELTELDAQLNSAAPTE
jgi:hypothetical protein